MGAVFAADQIAPVERRDAIKVIKAGMDSKAVIGRFMQERQALALMDHPNIARIDDGGTTRLGRPFFVMELVRGLPLTDYCDQHKLSIRQRIELLIPICRCHAIPSCAAAANRSPVTFARSSRSGPALG
jgi:serine/threonine protein kinase